MRDDAAMTKTTKIILGISLTSFALSLTGVLWGLFLPVAVIFFGLFLISNALAKEVARFDEEQASRISLAEKTKSTPANLPQAQSRPALRAASAH